MEKTRQHGELTVSLRTRMARKQGGFAKDKAAAVPVQALELLPDARDRRALPLLQAAATLTGSALWLPAVRLDGYGYERRFTSEAQIPAAMADELMPLLAETGRLFMRRELERRAGARDVRRRAAVGVRPRALPQQRGAESEITGLLQRGAESVPLSAPLLMTTSGWVLFERSVGRLRHFDAFAMLASLRGRREAGAARRRRGGVPGAPLRPAHASPAGATAGSVTRGERRDAEPHLKIGPPAPRAGGLGRQRASDRPTAELSFRYDGLPIAFADPRAT